MFNSKTQALKHSLYLTNLKINVQTVHSAKSKVTVADNKRLRSLFSDEKIVRILPTLPLRMHINSNTSTATLLCKHFARVLCSDNPRGKDFDS